MLRLGQLKQGQTVELDDGSRAPQRDSKDVQANSAAKAKDGLPRTGSGHQAWFA